MKRAFASMFLFAVLGAAAADLPFGRIEGNPDVRLLDDGRKIELLANLRYIDQRGVVWNAPKGWVVDGATIPQAAWSIVGGPLEGKYRIASIFHDVACDQKTRKWEDVHEAFYNAMRATGVEPLRARFMYGAVYHFGPRWPHTLTEYVEDKDVGTQTDAIRRRFDKRSSMKVAIADHYVTGVGVAGAEKIPSGLKTLSVTVTPAPARTDEEGLKKLKAAIEAQDLTLEQIRNLNLD